MKETLPRKTITLTLNEDELTLLRLAVGEFDMLLKMDGEMQRGYKDSQLEKMGALIDKLEMQIQFSVEES